MKVLWVGTKPPWPTVDGGRLLAALTIDALAAAGVHVDVVAPAGPGRAAGGEDARSAEGRHLDVVPGLPAGRARALLRAVRCGGPVSIARHSVAAVRREVERRLGQTTYDLVHAEQLQAWPQCEGARRRG